jgi:PadR family transcriptional regulator, regulatory protein PadR
MKYKYRRAIYLKRIYVLKGYMSIKIMGQKSKPGSGTKKAERYIQPSLLMALKGKPSYGYELLQNIDRFGFVEGQAPPGMIYRHLRDMEENGWVVSEWQTDEGGPAKRIYRLTVEGDKVLGAWIDYMNGQANKMLAFIKMYKDLVSGG